MELLVIMLKTVVEGIYITTIILSVLMEVCYIFCSMIENALVRKGTVDFRAARRS